MNRTCGFSFRIVKGSQGDAIIKRQNAKAIVLKKLPYEFAIRHQDLIYKVLDLLLRDAVELPNVIIIPDADLKVIEIAPYLEEEILNAKVHEIEEEARVEEFFEEEEEEIEEEIEDEEEPAIIEVVDQPPYEGPAACIRVIALEDIPIEGEDVEVEIPVEVVEARREEEKNVIATIETTATVRQRRDSKKHDYSCYVSVNVRVTKLPVNNVAKVIIEIPELEVKRELLVTVKQRRDAKKHDFGRYISAQVRLGSNSRVRSLVGRSVRVRVRVHFVSSH